MVLIEEAKAITMNDALTRILVHYQKFMPYNIRCPRESSPARPIKSIL
jgi:hypothetical protein